MACFTAFWFNWLQIICMYHKPSQCGRVGLLNVKFSSKINVYKDKRNFSLYSVSDN